MYSGIKPWTLLSAIAATSVSMSSVYAQGSGAELDKLEEIVITAERREESIQKTSISIATVSGDTITEQGLTNVEQILKNVPAVIIVGTARGAAVAIRGLGFDLPPQVGESATSMNFDGVYNFRSESGTYGYFDLNRVEVLRGPQGTLYGRNATGGVVNVISNSPGQDFEARGTLELGNYNLLRAEGAINVPVTDSLAARAAFVAINRDGFLSNGQNDAVGQAGRLKTLYKPNDDFSVQLAGEYAKIGGKGPGTTSNAFFNAGTPLQSSDTSATATANSNYYQSYRVSAQLDATVGPGVVTFLPAYQSADGYNWSAGMGGTFARSNDPIYAKQTSAELRYASAAGAAVKWVGGAYYYKKDDLGEAFGGTTGNQTRSKAVFAQTTVPLTDSFRVIAGVRNSWDEKGYRATSATNVVTGNSDKRSAFDWKTGLETDLGDASLLYLTVATGHRPGGFNVLADSMAALVTPGSFYTPESLRSYELGSKNRFLNERLQINGAAFLYDYKDYQIADIYAFVPALAAQFVNADARIYGAELEMQALLGAGTSLNVGVNYLHSRLTEGVVRPGSPFNEGDILSHSPEWSVRAGLQHVINLGDSGTLTPSVDYRYTAEQFVNSNNLDPANLQDAYSSGDVGLMYRSADEKWSVNTYLKNVNDKVVKLFAAGPNPQVSSPRTWGIVFSAKM